MYKDFHWTSVGKLDKKFSINDQTTLLKLDEYEFSIYKFAEYDFWDLWATYCYFDSKHAYGPSCQNKPGTWIFTAACSINYKLNIAWALPTCSFYFSDAAFNLYKGGWTDSYYTPASTKIAQGSISLTSTCTCTYNASPRPIIHKGCIVATTCFSKRYHKTLHSCDKFSENKTVMIEDKH